jgi:hypothetical protein
MKSYSEDSTLRPLTLGEAMIEDLLTKYTSTSTSCSHGRINPLKQEQSVDTSASAVLTTEYDWGIPLRTHPIAPCASRKQYWI